MLQRFASALFGDDAEELRRSGRAGDGQDRRQDRRQEDEDEDDWILVNYLADACSASCGPALSGPAPGCEDEEGEEDLVMVPSPMGSPPLRYASCTSLDSTADTEPDCGGGEEEEDEEEACGFLRLDAASLEESWFVTPPPCFTGRGGGGPALLEPSPLENLLIEHPSMSVYARRSPPRLPLDPLPRSLDLELANLLPGNLPAAAGAAGATPPASTGKKGRRGMDGARHRPDAAVQRRSGLHSACYAAALSARAGLLQPRTGAASAAAAAPPVSRNALRRLNLLRPPKVGAMQLHQPSHRHLNF